MDVKGGASKELPWTPGGNQSTMAVMFTPSSPWASVIIDGLYDRDADMFSEQAIRM